MIPVGYRRLACAASGASAVLVLASLAMGQGQKEERKKTDEVKRNERISGVIIRAESTGDTKEGPATVRLTVNVAAVWEDYSRDAATTEEVSVDEAAKKGKESIATRGQPRDEDTLTTIEVASEIPIQLRYRAEMDSSSLGAGTLKEALRVEPGKSDESATESERRGKSLKADQLKPGLFVHVQAHRADERNSADRVVVLVPVREQTKP